MKSWTISRDVAKQLGPRLAEERPALAGHGTEDADQRPRDQRDQQREQRHCEGPAPGLHQPLQVCLAAPGVLEEDAQIKFAQAALLLDNALTTSTPPGRDAEASKLRASRQRIFIQFAEAATPGR